MATSEGVTILSGRGTLALLARVPLPVLNEVQDEAFDVGAIVILVRHDLCPTSHDLHKPVVLMLNKPLTAASA